MEAKKNKPLEIASVIVGALFTVTVAAEAVVLIIQVSSSELWDLEGAGVAGLIMLPLNALMVIIAISVALFAVGCLVAAILPVFLKKPYALRRLAIITIVILALIIIIYCKSIFGYIADGFSEENLLSDILRLVSFIISLIWFALNITKTVIYRKK